MSEGFWPISYWFARQGIDQGLTDLVQGLVASEGKEQAERIASLVELRVAPPRGGLGHGADTVLHLLSACLPLMAPSTRSAALGLMTKICGSLVAAGAEADARMKSDMSRALPYIAGLVQFGDADLRAEFVDYASLSATLDGQVASEVAFYLRLLADAGGAVGASAEVELRELLFREMDK